MPIAICGTIAVGLQTTIAGGPKLAAADLPQLANLAPDAAVDEAEPTARPRQFAAPSHGPGDARHQAAAAMLLLLVATARSNHERGEDAQRQAAAAERTGLPVGKRTADARQLR